MKSWKLHSIRSILSLSLREKAGHTQAFTFLWFGACTKFQHKRSVCVRFQVLSLPQTQPCARLSGKADLWRSDFLSYDATVTICRRLVSCWESDFWAQYRLEQKGNADKHKELWRGGKIYWQRMSASKQCWELLLCFRSHQPRKHRRVSPAACVCVWRRKRERMLPHHLGFK